MELGSKTITNQDDEGVAYTKQAKSKGEQSLCNDEKTTRL